MTSIDFYPYLRPLVLHTVLLPAYWQRNMIFNEIQKYTHKDSALVDIHCKYCFLIHVTLINTYYNCYVTTCTHKKKLKTLSWFDYKYRKLFTIETQLRHSVTLFLSIAHYQLLVIKTFYKNTWTSYDNKFITVFRKAKFVPFIQQLLTEIYIWFHGLNSFLNHP